MVTGATRGIGRVTAVAQADAGWDVAEWATGIAATGAIWYAASSVHRANEARASVQAHLVTTGPAGFITPNQSCHQTPWPG
jgi:NAD(P)-dependent dehydrogenase (short-subunit alcohol dehydrogenase family)